MSNERLKIGDEAWVLCWLPGTQGMTWCKVWIAQSWKGRFEVEFADRSGRSVFPVGDVYTQPDLGLSGQVQSV